MDRVEITDKNNQELFRGRAFQNDKFDPEFKEIARRFLCGDVLEHGTLSQKQRALIIITALATGQSLKSPYAVAALDAGASPEEIKETLYQCAPYIGLEKVIVALSEVNRAFQASNITSPQAKQSTVTEKTRFENGLAVQEELFGQENIESMRAGAPEELVHIQEYLSAYCFGDFYTRGALDLKLRELITFCAICCLGGCEPQAKAHAEANLNVGNTRETLIEAITQCLPFIGFPRALNAITCIDAVTNEK